MLIDIFKITMKRDIIVLVSPFYMCLKFFLRKVVVFSF